MYLNSREYLCHYNDKHDARGRFARKAGSSAKSTSDKLFSPTVNKKGNPVGKPPAEKIVNEMSKASTASAQGIRQTGKDVRKVSFAKRDPRTMSDQELQQAIYRMNLERQYNSLTTADIQTGYGKTADILSTMGTVLAVGGSAVSIYATLRGLK